MPHKLPFPVAVYLGGRWLSSAGDWLCSIALGWVIANIFDGGSSLYAVSRLLTALALVLFTPVAVDILSRGGTVRLGVASSLGSALNSVLCAVAVVFFTAGGDSPARAHTTALAVVLLLCFSSGVFAGFRESSESSLQGGIVPRELQPRFENLWTVSYYAGRILLGMLAGWIGMVFGSAVLFLLDASSFVVLALMILFVGRRTVEPAHAKPPLRAATLLRTVAADLVAGARGYFAAAREVRNDRTLLMLLWMLFVVEGIGYTAWNYLPEIVKRELHGDVYQYGAAVAISGLGGLIGILTRMVVLRRWKWAGPSLFAAAFVIAPASLIGVSYSSSVTEVGIWYGVSLCGWTWLSVPIRLFCKLSPKRYVAVTVHTLVLFGLCRISQVAVTTVLTFGAGFSASAGLRTSASASLLLAALTVLILPRTTKRTTDALFRSEAAGTVA